MLFEFNRKVREQQKNYNKDINKYQKVPNRNHGAKEHYN